MRPRPLATSALFFALLRASTARAEPEWNVGIAAGVAGRSRGSELWSDTAFHGAARGDVLWGRRRWDDLGIGPSGEIGTFGFRDARLHFGGTLVLPLGSLLSLLATPAAYARTSGSLAFGASGRILLGFRSFNHSGSYAIESGLVFGVDQDLAGNRERVLSVAAQIDGALLAIPFIALAQWIRGTPRS